jgi:hypothetical protein
VCEGRGTCTSKRNKVNGLTYLKVSPFCMCHFEVALAADVMPVG